MPWKWQARKILRPCLNRTDILLLNNLDINLFILLGAALQTSAMLFRNQILLRLLFIVGGGCYIAYYIYVLPAPLWAAATASIAMVATTAIGLFSLLIGRSKIIIPKDSVGLYQQMGNIPPGEFRLLLKYSHRRRLERKETLTIQNETPEKLYFIVSGQIDAHKNGHVFPLHPGFSLERLRS